MTLLSLGAYRRLGYRTLAGDGARRQLRAELAAIKAGRRWSTLGVEVSRCNDNVWQEVVTEALSAADLAVVDISDLTSNLQWELHEAMRTLSERRVILVYPEESGSPEEMLANLKGGPTDTPGARLVAYPPAQPAIGWGGRRYFKAFAGRLRTEIAECLVAGSTR